MQTPIQTARTQQSIEGIHITSDLGSAYGWTLPWAKNGVGVAFGFEHRTEKLNLATDTFFSVPEGTGQGGPTIGLGGQYTVNEVFAELRVPIMEKQPWAELLSVNGSYRYSDYSTDHRTNSYGLGAEWAPVKEYRVRGTYQHAVRAANIIELFTAQGANLFNMAPTLRGQCGRTAGTDGHVGAVRATGLNPAQYGTRIPDTAAGQYNFLQGGNLTLSPETAKSWTLGLVLERSRTSPRRWTTGTSMPRMIGIVPRRRDQPMSTLGSSAT
jgi:outer membrane receptor protein involved in Fe transport